MPTTPLTSAAQQVIAKALIDSHFRDALTKNTDATLASEGLNAEETSAIKNLKPHEWGKLSLNDIHNRIGKVAGVTVSTVTTKQGH